MSQAQSRQPVLLRDYRPPAFLTPSIELEFVLEPDATLVTARQRFERNPQGSGDLVLRGEDQELLAIKLDGVPLVGALPGRGRPPDCRRATGRLHPRGHQPHQPQGQHQPDGPLSQQWRVLHPVRARGLSPDRLVAGSPRCDVRLPGADRGGRGGLSGAAVQRQPAGNRTGPVAGIGHGRTRSQARLSVRAGGWRPRLPRRRVRDAFRPHGAAANLTPSTPASTNATTPWRR